MTSAARFAIAIVSLSACDPKANEPEPCTEIIEFGCDIVECVEVKGALRCAFDVYAEPGHDLDIAIELPGEAALDWNAWPWNADAGDFEDLNLKSEGAACGEFSLDLDGAEARGHVRPRSITLVCTDWTAGVFATSAWEL